MVKHQGNAAIAPASQMMMMMLPFMSAASCVIPENIPNGSVRTEKKVKKTILKKKDDDSHQGDISSPCPSPVIAEPVIAKSSESSSSSHRSIQFTMDTARIVNERMFHRISHLWLANFALFSAFVRLWFLVAATLSTFVNG